MFTSRKNYLWRESNYERLFGWRSRNRNSVSIWPSTFDYKLCYVKTAEVELRTSGLLVRSPLRLYSYELNWGTLWKIWKLISHDWLFSDFMTRKLTQFLDYWIKPYVPACLTDRTAPPERFQKRMLPLTKQRKRTDSDTRALPFGWKVERFRNIPQPAHNAHNVQSRR
jgi:hypothetical protein